MDHQEIALLSTWAVNFLYFVGVLPQIWLNYKLKTTRGLSDWMLFGYAVGYFVYLYYIFLLPLPLSYKILVPPATITYFVLIAQRFYYNSLPSDNRIIVAYIIAFITLTAGLYPASHFPMEIGTFAGWLSAILWTISKVPQAIEIFLKKSVKGFSFAFITIINLGILIELLAAFYLQLPMPTIVFNIGALLFYLIFCVQFQMYP